MPAIPLERRLKKSSHKRLALAQDMLVDSLYRFLPRAIIHGGTSIWRCYGGNRFSEDIDLYLKSASEDSFQDLLEWARKDGFSVSKFKRTDHSLFSKFEISGEIVKLEAIIKDIKRFIVRPFERTDGTFTNVYTLSVEDMILEKIAAYQNRQKIRDLYDIWFLLNLVQRPEKINAQVSSFAEKINKPEDYSVLKTLLILGPTPAFDDLTEGIASWAKRNT